ncbi:MAG: YgjV family protein [Clostridia bacterium]|nr:YgjV family protein [Clostridia bacterium]
MNTILIQSIGIVGAVFGFIAYQCNKHNKIMVFKTVSECIFAVQFALLGAYTGVAMNILGSTRNLVFSQVVKKNKSTLPYIILFAVLSVGAVILTWGGPISLLAMAGKLCTTVAFGFCKPQTVRFISFPGSILWIIYDLINFSLAGVITEVFAMISIIFASARYFKANAKPKAALSLSHSGRIA